MVLLDGFGSFLSSDNYNPDIAVIVYQNIELEKKRVYVFQISAKDKSGTREEINQTNTN